MGLMKNTAQCSHGDLALPGHDHGIDGFARAAYELYVATLLMGFYESRSLKPSLPETAEA